MVDKAGMEGTGSFGAGLLRFLANSGLTVIEAGRPDRAGPRRNGKPDGLRPTHLAPHTPASAQPPRAARVVLPLTRGSYLSN